MQMSGPSADWIGTLDGSLRVHGSTVALSYLSTTRNSVASNQHGEPLNARQEAAQLLELQADHPAFAERQFQFLYRQHVPVAVGLRQSRLPLRQEAVAAIFPVCTVRPDDILFQSLWIEFQSVSANAL